MNTPNGVIDQSVIGRKNDYLFRLSLKALIVNDKGEVLVVKESGRTWWDLPGGGMDHNESIEQTLKRELFEEVNLSGDFNYQVIDVDNPALLTRANVWQVRLILRVIPDDMHFSAGENGDEIAFVSPQILKESDIDVEQLIYHYFQKIM